VDSGKREYNSLLFIIYARPNIIGQKSKIYLLNVHIPFIWQPDAFEGVAMIHVDVPQ
jgi:hypothetical protein